MQEKQSVAPIFLYIGSIISLGITVSGFLTMVFGCINFFIRDAASNAQYAIMNAQEMIPAGIAMVLVACPAFFYIMRSANRYAEESLTPRAKTIKKICIALALGLSLLTLGIAGIMLLKDLLSGEITLRFLIKSSVVVSSAGVVAVYYKKLWSGYWDSQKKYATWYAYMVASVVSITLIASVVILNPVQVRKNKIDAATEASIESILSSINTYVQNNPGSVPSTLAEAQISQKEITYTKKSVNTYELCATFTTASIESVYGITTYSPNHYARKEAGNKCFTIQVQRNTSPYPSSSIVQ